MGEGFRKLKRQFLQSAVIKSAVCGVSFGLFAFAAAYIALNLAGIPLNTLYYILILLGGAVLCGGVCFLFFKPTDKKVAVELDKRYGLDEKAQSALAFREAQGAVAQMLQSDTESRLKSLPKEKFNFAKIWQYFLIGLLSTAIFVSAFFVPSATVSGGTGGGNTEVDSPYVFSEKEMDALQELIDNVTKSNLAKDIKDPTVESLNKLMNNLLFAEMDSEKKAYVNGTVSEIEKVIKEPLSYKSIANPLGRLGQSVLARMIADGVQVYKIYVIADYEDLVTFDSIKTTAVIDKIEDKLTAFLNLLEENASSDPAEKALRRDGEEGGTEGGEEGGEDEEEEKSPVVKAYTAIITSLAYSQVNEEDHLYTALFNLAQGMKENEDTLVNGTALKFDLEFKYSLAEQAYLLAANKYVINTLGAIFGVTVPADENFVPDEPENDEPPKQGGPTGGGFGKGDMLYGSDDLVYDPATGEYVTYGELFNYYYAIVESMLREGNLTEEQQAVIRAYFEILLSGLKEE